MYKYLQEKEELKSIVKESVESVLEKRLPQILKKPFLKEWLTTEDVMHILKCSRRHVQYLRDSGKLPFLKDGRTVRFEFDDIETYLKNHRIKFEG